MIILPGLKLRHVEVFLAVAEAASVSAAARRLNVSQPALSKSVGDIERLVGQRLFDRTGRRMVLTVAGTLFRRHALDAMHSLESGLQAIGGDSPREVLSVGVLPTVAGSLFPPVALRFAEARPKAYISVTTGPHGYLVEKLRRGDIDLMVGRMPEPDEMSGLRFEFLYDDAIELVARADHPNRADRVTHALRDAPVILPNRDSIIRRMVDGFLNAHGLATLRPALETVSRNLALPLLMDSDMLWFISRSVVARDLAGGRLTAFDLGAGYLSGAVGITLRQARDTDPKADTLVALLHSAVAE